MFSTFQSKVKTPGNPADQNRDWDESDGKDSAHLEVEYEYLPNPTVHYSDCDKPDDEESDYSEREFHSVTEFHLFPKLPIELRLIVWKFAVNQGRIIHLEPSATTTHSPFANLSGYPPLLATSSESRNVVKGIYILGFEKKLLRNAPMYFAPADTLYFTNIKNLKWFLSRDIKATVVQVLNNTSIKSVAIGEVTSSNDLFICKDFRPLGFRNSPHTFPKNDAVEQITRMFGLEKLIFLLDGSSRDSAKNFKECRVKFTPYGERARIEMPLGQYKRELEEYLSRRSSPALTHLNGQASVGGIYNGMRIPVVPSDWWKDPKITFNDKGRYLKNMISHASILHRSKKLLKAENDAKREKWLLRQIAKNSKHLEVVREEHRSLMNAKNNAAEVDRDIAEGINEDIDEWIDEDIYEFNLDIEVEINHKIRRIQYLLGEEEWMSQNLEALRNGAGN